MIFPSPQSDESRGGKRRNGASKWFVEEVDRRGFGQLPQPLVDRACGIRKSEGRGRREDLLGEKNALQREEGQQGEGAGNGRETANLPDACRV